MVSLLKGAGKSRENRLCSAGWRSRLRPETGDCPLEPVLVSNLQHLHFSECQLEPWETRWDSELGTLTSQQSCLALTGAGNRGAGTVPKPSAARFAPNLIFGDIEGKLDMLPHRVHEIAHRLPRSSLKGASC